MKLRRPSPALVIACLALFVSLGGVSYGVATGYIDSREIKDGTIRQQDIRNNEIRGRDVRNSTILSRDVATDSLRGADIDERRLNIVESTLGKVPDADRLDGVDSSAFVRRDAVGFLPLTAGRNWTAGTGGDAPQVDVDELGNVQLRGTVTQEPAASDAAVTLPAGARPAARRRFVAWSSTGTPVQLVVEPSGAVIPEAGDGVLVSLDGVVFRAHAR